MKEVVESIDARIKSPLFGYFIFAVIAFNWAEFYYLFFALRESAETKIEYFSLNTTVNSLFWLPLLTSSIYSVLYPWTNLLFTWIGARPQKEIDILQAKAESALLTAKAKEKEARNKLQRSEEESILEKAKTDSAVQNIPDENIRERAEAEIEKVREEDSPTGGSVAAMRQIRAVKSCLKAGKIADAKKINKSLRSNPNISKQVKEELDLEIQNSEISQIRIAVKSRIEKVFDLENKEQYVDAELMWQAIADSIQKLPPLDRPDYLLSRITALVGRKRNRGSDLALARSFLNELNNIKGLTSHQNAAAKSLETRIGIRAEGA